MAEIDQIEGVPSNHRQGDSLSFFVIFDRRYSSENWSAELVLAGPNQVESYTGRNDGGGRYSWSLTSEETSLLEARLFAWAIRLSTQDGERVTPRDGTIEIDRDFTDGLSVNDSLSHAERVLRAIEAMIEGRATKDQQSTSLNGTSLSRFSWEELLGLRDRYRQEVNQERRRARQAQGLPPGGKIRVLGR
ncbi:MAG: hypothetical protein AAF515_05080 [Pseudomonadota bacterium]